MVIQECAKFESLLHIFYEYFTSIINTEFYEIG